MGFGYVSIRDACPQFDDTTLTEAARAWQAKIQKLYGAGSILISMTTLRRLQHCPRVKGFWGETLWAETLWGESFWCKTVWGETLWGETLWGVTLWSETLWGETLRFRTVGAYTNTKGCDFLYSIFCLRRTMSMAKRLGSES